jgi:hypothetical protein
VVDDVGGNQQTHRADLSFEILDPLLARGKTSIITQDSRVILCLEQ